MPQRYWNIIVDSRPEWAKSVRLQQRGLPSVEFRRIRASLPALHGLSAAWLRPEIRRVLPQPSQQDSLPKKKPPSIMLCGASGSAKGVGIS
jgi:hypothetical protein